MKKTLLLFAVVVAMFLSACDPYQDGWIWEIKNQSGETLKFKYITQKPPGSAAYGAYNKASIPPGGTLTVYGFTTKTGKKTRFGEYFKTLSRSHGEDVYWQILSEDDVVLRTWRYADAGLPNRRFFEESSWDYQFQPSDEAFVVAYYVWTFNILTEDLQVTQ